MTEMLCKRKGFQQLYIFVTVMSETTHLQYIFKIYLLIES